MGLHLTRWVLGTVNLLLAGLLTCFWILVGGGMEWGPGGIGYWMLVFFLLAMTITTSLAGVYCLMRRTLPLALKWNRATGFTWVAIGMSGIVSSLIEKHGAPGDPEVISIVAAFGFFWFFMGWSMRQFLRLQNRKDTVDTHGLLSVPATDTTFLSPDVGFSSLNKLPAQEPTIVSVNRLS